MKTVNILMSTYNGEKYLKTQIDSILNQTDVDVRLTIRDDGSNDNTKEIIKAYSDNKSITWYEGENLRPACSFMHLLANAEDAEYYAFADQDDYWEPEKMKTAIEHLAEIKGPALYFSQTQLTDENLNKIKTRNITPLLTFGESMVYAFATGCTMVMNKPLRDFIVAHQPKTMPMLHDYWIYTLSKAIGAEIRFDTTPHLLYRQHTANVVGMNDNFWETWHGRIKRVFIDKTCERSRNIRILTDCIGDYMDEENKRIASLFINAKHSIKDRIKLLFAPEYATGDRTNHWLFRIAVILNSY